MRRGEDPLRVDQRGAANLEAEGLKRRRERVREGVGGYLGAAHDAGRHAAVQPSALSALLAALRNWGTNSKLVPFSLERRCMSA